jgi:hypothetical protein
MGFGMQRIGGSDSSIKNTVAPWGKCKVISQLVQRPKVYAPQPPSSLACPTTRLLQKEYGSDRQGSTKYLAAFQPEPMTAEMNDI